MKLGIMADSHENMPLIAKAVELFNREEVDLVLHAGDFISPITAKEFKNLKAKLIGVFGNNDGDKLFLQRTFQDIGELYEDYHELKIEGKKVILMHQPKLLRTRNHKAGETYLRLGVSGFYNQTIYASTNKVYLLSI